MASVVTSSSPIDNVENEPTDESTTTKPKRLPRSAKKRLRYERLREHYRLNRKKKKTHPSYVVIQPDPSENSSEQGQTLTGKVYRRTANKRLADINEESAGPVICIDCAYNETMSKKEIASLARQIGRCYSSNRRAAKPVRLMLTNWSNDNQLATECRRVNSGFDNYQIIRNDKSVLESHPIERLVYLSPNSDKILTEISEENVYVIGGLVDESVRKNMTYEICQEKNIVCYKLPIETYMEHSVNGGTFNQILAINQVFDIFLTYLTTKDWRDALKKHIPERKGWVIKNPTDKTEVAS